MKRILLAGAAVVALSTSSQAADYSAYTPLDVWSGWYVGVQGGYAFAEADISPPESGLTVDEDGGFGGLYWGRNWQSGNWVFGLDGSVSFSAIEIDGEIEDALVPVTGELKGFSATRVRVGYAFDNVLLFAAVGGSIGRLDVDSPVITGSDDEWLFGFTAGAGLDVKLADNWSARLEYLYINYGDEDFFDDAVNIDIDDVHAVRAGIAYHF